MRSLFWKGMLAFLAIIVVAVGTVALLVGRVTENELRRYALVQGGMWTHLVSELSDHYASRGSWNGAENVLQGHRGMGPRGQTRGMGMVGSSFDFQIASTAGEIVVNTSGSSGGIVSQAELDGSIPIVVDGQVVGHLFPSSLALDTIPLDASQAEFLARVQQALWIATFAALVAAIIVGGLLFRSIVAPLRQLTAASQVISRGQVSAGDLSVRVPVRGRDEVAQLAQTFNQMMQNLARAETTRKNQTADIAHELRTPLTVVQGTLEAMLDGVYPTDRENLEAVLAQVRTLSRQVEDLRILALADAGQLKVHKEAVDLDRFLREVAAAHQPQSEERGVALALEIPPTPLAVLADRDRLAQVMGNLLNNALRHVPEGGQVTVQVAEQETGPVVAVVDDGPGVSPQELPHLFERYWRADRTIRPAVGGSGLGLSISRRIVEAHGGRIWAEPTPGGGLTVAFTLPGEV